VDLELSYSPVILFDGVCNLCNRSVNFILKRDSGKIYKFASLQSDAAINIFSKHNLNLDKFDTIVLIKDQKVYQKSNAILEVTRSLGGLWPLLYVFKLIPRFLRDALYDYIAKNRYSWFGKSDQCRVPTPDLKERFLEA